MDKPLFSRKQLIQLLWPLIVEQFLSVFIGMVDVLMVAYVGEATVSGVSLVDSVNHLVIQVLFAVTAGGTVVCAQCIGGGDKKNAAKSGAQLLLLSFAVMLFVATIFFCGGTGILKLLFGQVETDVMSSAVKYMYFTVASFPFLAIYHSSASIFRAQGNSRVSMLVSLGMNLFNIAGNALCIFVLHMGVVGVALPTLVSRALGAIVLLMLVQKKENTLRIPSIKYFTPHGILMKRILAIGIPNGIESGLFNVGKILLQSLVSTLGTPSIAAYAVANNLVTYLYLPGNALGAAMITIVGQCHGAGQPEEAKRYAKILVAINYAMAAVIAAVLIIGRHFWVSCYSLTGESAYYAAGLVLSHSIAMILWPIGFLLPYYFRASGHARFTMFVAIFAMALFRVGGAYLFVKVMHKDVLWVWFAMFIDWIFRVIIYPIAFLKKDFFKKRSFQK